MTQKVLFMRYTVRVFCCVILSCFILSTCMAGMADAAQEETMMGAVVKRGKDFVIEADEGDYLVKGDNIVKGGYTAKGKDLSKFVGKLVIVTGVVTESPRGDIIEIKSIENIQDSMDE